MPLFEITIPMTATIIVECSSEKEAVSWANNIVVGIEDKDGNQIQSNKIVSFEASVEVSEIEITRLKEF